jgi:hypothetical protein
MRRLTLGLFDAEELGDIDGLSITSGNDDREVRTGNTSVIGLRSINGRLNFYSNIECFCLSALFQG